MAEPAGHHSFTFEGIGTEWEVSTQTALPVALRSRLRDRVEAFDGGWSRFRRDSLVGAMARTPGRYHFPAEAEVLGQLYRRLYEVSGGAMTPLVGAGLEQLGYGPGYVLQPRGPAAPVPAWDDVLEWNGQSITVHRPVVLDVGAAGKGMLVDLLAAELDDAGVEAYCIDASGDLLVRGLGPLAVGLEHPYNPKQAIGIVSVQDQALCASAANRRAWGDGLHHILDGTTGRPVRMVVSTWALADTTVLADALATALFFLPGGVLEQQFDFSWLTVFSDGSAAYSPGFAGTLFT